MRPISVTFSFLISILFWTPPRPSRMGRERLPLTVIIFFTLYSHPLGSDRLPLTVIICFTIYSPPLWRARSLEEALNVLLCLVRGELSSSTRGLGKGEGPLQSTPASTSLTTLSTSLSSFSGSYSFLSEALNVHANT